MKVTYEDIAPVPIFQNAYKSYRVSFFVVVVVEKVEMPSLL